LGNIISGRVEFRYVVIAADKSGDIYVVDGSVGNVQKFALCTSYTPTFTITPTVTKTQTSTFTSTWSPTASSTFTNSPSPTISPTPTITQTWTNSPGYTATPTFSISQTFTISKDLHVFAHFHRHIDPLHHAGHFLQVCAEVGQLWDGHGSFDYPTGVATDLTGNVYVADTNNQSYSEIDTNGNFLNNWGSYGLGNGQFNGLGGLVVDSSGNIYVTDSYNHRYKS